MLDGARPELVAFLQAVRQSGNAYWSTHRPDTLDGFRARGVGGSTWAQGTRWIDGFSEQQIDALAVASGVTFPSDYRAFLAILGGTDRPALRFAYEGAELARQADRYIFTNWLDDTALQRSFDHALDGILFDVEHGIWFDGWGPRPDSEAARRDLVLQLMEAAPRLIPIHGHRFLIGGLDLSPAPVLSLVQTDFIVYASSIENLLTKDFAVLCGAQAAEVEDGDMMNAQFEHLRSVPFWSEFLT